MCMRWGGGDVYVVYIQSVYSYVVGTVGCFYMIVLRLLW